VFSHQEQQRLKIEMLSANIAIALMMAPRLTDVGVCNKTQRRSRFAVRLALSMDFGSETSWCHPWNRDCMHPFQKNFSQWSQYQCFQRDSEAALRETKSGVEWSWEEQ
jgi:hypothetical protein